MKNVYDSLPVLRFCEFVGRNDKFVPKSPNIYVTKSKNAQEAHEAIRPTHFDSAENNLAGDEKKLYDLIWKRTIACQMTNAEFDSVAADILTDDKIATFHTVGRTRTFDGFMKVYVSSDEEKEEKNNTVSGLAMDSVISAAEFEGTQHFTQPPAHFSESSIVKTMEELGIGRPSTYSPTITTILARHYVKKEKKNIIATELGKVVNDIMVTAFPDIVDTGFTARIEESLDRIEEGDENWKKVIRDFYPGLRTSINDAREKLTRIKVKDEVTDVICDKCGRNMVIKFGPHGKFLACPGFPECRNTMPIIQKAGAQCPECGREMIIRKTQKGRIYYACEGYPECKYMSWTKPGKQEKEK